jgi:hypothetical protein
MGTAEYKGGRSLAKDIEHLVPWLGLVLLLLDKEGMDDKVLQLSFTRYAKFSKVVYGTKNVSVEGQTMILKTTDFFLLSTISHPLRARARTRPLRRLQLSDRRHLLQTHHRRRVERLAALRRRSLRYLFPR